MLWLKKIAPPPEGTVKLVLHHETGETWHSEVHQGQRRHFFLKERTCLPAAVEASVFGYWYYLFWSVGSILICNPERMGQKMGRKKMEADSPKAALGIETTWIISSQDILSRTPTSVWAASQLITNPQYQGHWRPGSLLGLSRHLSRFQRPPCSIFHTRSLSGRVWVMCRT